MIEVPGKNKYIIKGISGTNEVCRYCTGRNEQ